MGMKEMEREELVKKKKELCLEQLIHLKSQILMQIIVNAHSAMSHFARMEKNG